MRLLRFTLLLAAVLGAAELNAAPTIGDLAGLWRQTFDALKSGQRAHARELFQTFNQDLPLYLSVSRLDWRIEYLAGTLDCQFEESRETGTNILKALYQDSRDISDAGRKQILHLVRECTASAISTTNADEPGDPGDILVAAAHLQMPGIHSFTKGGYLTDFGGEKSISGMSVAPKPASELLARRLPVSHSQEALKDALDRLPAGATGAVDSFFAVTYPGPDKSVASGIGKCLRSYVHPLTVEFGMARPDYVVTVYTTDTEQIYDLAARLHGLQLPQGVVAYSVSEDMSLAGSATPSHCGSMAHELVHLLNKPTFPVAPAWLEEGLASEVAVASPKSDSILLNYSWRDDLLKEYWSLRPSVGQLLEMSWPDFTAANSADLPRAAAIQSMAAAFIRYLDAQKKLRDIFLAARDEHLSADLSHYRSYQEIVSEKLGRNNIDDVDQDFKKWFAQENAPSPTRALGSPGPCKMADPRTQTACPPAPNSPHK